MAASIKSNGFPQKRVSYFSSPVENYYARRNASKDRTVKVMNALSQIESDKTNKANVTLPKKQQQLLLQLNQLKECIRQQEKQIVQLKQRLSMAGQCDCGELNRNDMMSSNPDELNDYKCRLKELQSRLVLSERIIKDKNSKINELNRIVHERDISVSSGGDVLNRSSNTERIKQLKGLLDIYKAQLKDTITEINSYKAMVGKLRKTISSLRNSSLANKGIDKYRHNDRLACIQQELLMLKKKILRLESSSLHHINGVGKDYRDELLSLKQRLNEIDAFLRGELTGVEDIMHTNEAGHQN